MNLFKQMFGNNRKETVPDGNSGSERPSLEECLYQMAVNWKNGDSEAAYEWGEKAADMGSTDAMHFIGNMFFYNHFRPVKKGTADFLKKALQNNGSVMPWDMTDEYEPDYRSAYKWYLRAAENGNGDSMNNVGNMLYLGSGCEKDVEKAKYWLQKAIEKGVPYAMKAYQAYFGDITLPYKSDKEYKALLDEFEDCANRGLAGRCHELHGKLIIGTDRQLAKFGYVIAKGKYNTGGLYQEFDYPRRKDGEPYSPVHQFRGEWRSYVRIDLNAFDDDAPVLSLTWDGHLWDGLTTLKCITQLQGELTYTSGEFGWSPEQKMAYLLKIDKTIPVHFPKSENNWLNITENDLPDILKERLEKDGEAWFIDWGEKEYSVEICQIKDNKAIILYRYTIGGWNQGDKSPSEAKIISVTSRTP
jgi:hypothetical protein